jgi:hypothetical protein
VINCLLSKPVRVKYIHFMFMCLCQLCGYIHKVILSSNKAFHLCIILSSTELNCSKLYINMLAIQSCEVQTILSAIIILVV